MLTVYGRRSSVNVQKVMWLVGELNLPHKHVPLGGSHGGLNAPEFRALNPHGQVPTITDDGATVWESHAILRYLAARHGAPRFWSDDPAARARVDAWMDWSQTRWQPAFITGVFWGLYRTPPGQRDERAVAVSIDRSARAVQALDDALADHDHLAGDALSLADIAAGSLLYRYFTMDIARPSVPRVEAWYARLCELPAYAEHVMVPYDELRGRLAF